jgi:hypothetical protein
MTETERASVAINPIMAAIKFLARTGKADIGDWEIKEGPLRVAITAIPLTRPT